MMKNIYLGIALSALFSCSNSNQKSTPLNNGSEWVEQTIDSLKSEIYLRDSSIYRLRDSLKPTELNSQEKEVRKMFTSLVKALYNNQKDKSNAQILKHFSKNFTVNWVNVNVKNEAQAAHYTHQDFNTYLNKTRRKEKNLDFKIVSINILAIEIKGNIFNAAFKVFVNTYKKGELLEKISTTVSLAGRKKGQYKIASLNAIVFRYPTNHTFK